MRGHVDGTAQQICRTDNKAEQKTVSRETLEEQTDRTNFVRDQGLNLTENRKQERKQRKHERQRRDSKNEGQCVEAERTHVKVTQ
jgi:hypothetical protein